MKAYEGPYMFRMDTNPFGGPEIINSRGTLEVWLDARRIAKVDCQTCDLPVFLVHEGVLYYADPAGYTTGCTVGAFDLVAREQLWRTRLMALEPAGVNHSLYRNEATLRVEGKRLIVSATEAAGDYVEALDLATGKTVARCLGDFGGRRSTNMTGFNPALSEQE